VKAKRFAVTAIALVGAVSLVLVSSRLLHAQVTNTFTNATLNDRYGFHVVALHSNGQPFAISGYYQFNGDGTLSGKDTVSAGSPDVIVHRSYTGTYQVNSDGTGTLQLNMSPSFQPIGEFTIVYGGKAIEIVFAVPGNMNAFTLRKQNTQ
jgi:hypothetical protein